MRIHRRGNRAVCCEGGAYRLETTRLMDANAACSLRRPAAVITIAFHHTSPSLACSSADTYTFGGRRGKRAGFGRGGVHRLRRRGEGGTRGVAFVSPLNVRICCAALLCSLPPGLTSDGTASGGAARVTAVSVLCRLDFRHGYLVCEEGLTCWMKKRKLQLRGERGRRRGFACPAKSPSIL